MTSDQALKIAIEAINYKISHKQLAANASAERYNFEFGRRAKKQLERYRQAIAIMEGLVQQI